MLQWLKAFRSIGLALVLTLLSVWALAARAEPEFLEPEQAFQMQAAMASPTELQVHYTIAPGYYMYRERFEFKLDNAPNGLKPAVFPAGHVKHDPTFDKKMEVYYEQVTARIALAEDLSGPQTLTLTGQGCADAGICYPPMTRTLMLKPAVGGGYALEGPGALPKAPPAWMATPADQSASPASSKSGTSVTQAVSNTVPVGVSALGSLTDTGLARYLATVNVWTIVAACFVLGLLLTFTPCVLPMVPIVLAVVAGSRPGAAPARGRGLVLAAIYVLGVSLVYTALGVAAGLLGAGLAAWLQNPWVLSAFALLLALLALAMFNVFVFQAPSGMQSQLNTWLSRVPGGQYGSAFIMGVVSAFIVGPCVAAPLAGVLLFISQTGNAVVGAAALFALAWGQGVLLLVLGAGAGVLLPKVGPWMEGVRRLFGVLLLATAWWMLNPVVPGWASALGWGVLALWSAILLGVFTDHHHHLWAALRRAVGVVLLIWGTAILLGVAAGRDSVLQPLSFSVVSGSRAASGAGVAVAQTPQFERVDSEQALDAILASSDRPVMLDFYADWCVSCIEMEKFTFSNPQVAAAMGQFRLLQADVTANNAADRALLKRFNLFGPPGIMFFDANGRLLDNERVVGFMKANAFLDVLQRVQAASDSVSAGR